MQKCPRCGKANTEAGAFCSFCGAALPQRAKKATAPPALPSKRVKLYTILLGLCALLLSAVILILVDGFNATGGAFTSAAAVQRTEEFLRPTPSPTASPPPPQWGDILGVWMASRVEINKSKQQPYVETFHYPYGMYVEFLEDGAAYFLFPSESEEDVVVMRPYSAEGDSLYIDYGIELIDDMVYYGRTRYFIKNGTLYSVYLLDGREASDYVVFSPVLIEEAPIEEAPILPARTIELARSAAD